VFDIIDGRCNYEDDVLLFTVCAVTCIQTIQYRSLRNIMIKYMFLVLMCVVSSYTRHIDHVFMNNM